MALSISDRAVRMPPSPIRKLVPFADKAKERGIHVFHLNIGQPDVKTPPEMMKSLRELDVEVIAYSHSQGMPRYVQSLIKYYGEHRIPLQPDNIVVTTGGSEAIIFSMMVALNPGDEVVIPEPFYTNYNGFANMAGVTIKPVLTKVEQGFHLPPREVFEQAIGPRTKALMICNPNNPTGTVLRPEEIEMVADLAREHDLWLMADEVYREFVFDGGEPRSILHLPGMEERVVVMDSLSKRYSVCGARIGCIVSRNKPFMEACLRFGQARLCSPTVEQIMSTAAHDLPQEYFDVTIGEYQRRRDAVFSSLEEMEGVMCLKPEGAFYNIARLPIDDADRFCQWLLTDFERDNRTLMLAPAAGFYASEGRGRDEVRIAYVLNVEDLKLSMELLDEALKQYRSAMM